MAYWETELGRALVRPVVLEGDISESGLGLSSSDVDWLRAHCRSAIHSAASLTFHADEPTGEPYRSNVQGTRNVLDLCRAAGIRQYHHVSTAYVCGLRRGRILETELDVGQQLGNDYEKTKIAAETEVLACPDFDCVTVYRPSIIVGDTRTGFTTSYHGFYTPLRLVYSLLQSVPWETILRKDWLGHLQLAGDERKNLVGVDWVSAAMSWLVTHPDCHGKTYHLTNPAPATTLSMREAMAEALAETVRGKQPPKASSVGEDFLDSFREQMGVYRAYWSDDPEFDSTQTQAALPHLPCPEIDAEVMKRLVRFAIDANFGWPRETPIVAPYDVESHFGAWLGATAGSRAEASAPRYISLNVSGPGGGQWHLATQRGRLVGVGLGLQNGASPTCYFTSATFAALRGGRLTFEDSINSGRLVVTGNSLSSCELERLFCDLASGEVTGTFQKAIR